MGNKTILSLVNALVWTASNYGGLGDDNGSIRILSGSYSTFGQPMPELIPDRVKRARKRIKERNPDAIEAQEEHVFTKKDLKLITEELCAEIARDLDFPGDRGEKIEKNRYPCTLVQMKEIISRRFPKVEPRQYMKAFRDLNLLPLTEKQFAERTIWEMEHFELDWEIRTNPISAAQAIGRILGRMETLGWTSSRRLTDLLEQDKMEGNE